MLQWPYRRLETADWGCEYGNVLEREELALMVAGESVEIKLQGYSVTTTERELMEKYDELLLENKSLG